MRILVDQNLPRRLIPLLQDSFPGSTHVNEVGLGGALDIEIWNFAVRSSFDIMSRDVDMATLAIRRTGDVCVLWIRSGNLRLRELIARIVSAIPEIHKVLRTRSLRVIELR
jgi:predicted nuclease of predicted toxin-antitoxin system